MNNFPFITILTFLPVAGAVVLFAMRLANPRFARGVALAFSLAALWGIVLAVAFWLGAVAVLQRMGKADPMLRQVYMRHVRYRAFYPAKSALFSSCVPHPSRWR